MHTYCKPIHQLHGTGSSMLAVSCGSKGMVSCVPTTGCAQKPWGDLQAMHTMWVQVVIIIKTS